jgi:UDP-N-acetylglucosamine:LPS N-acetylglucosamine transferase
MTGRDEVNTVSTPDRHVLLVGSSGGHLTQLWSLEPWWQDGARTWVTFDTPDATSLLANESVIWAHHPTTRNIPNLLRNTWLAWRTLRRVRPDVVVSTGAGVALPFFVFARVLRIPTAYIEVYDRIDSATLTGRLCRPFTSVMCVQWEEQRSLYRNAKVIGELL